MDAPTYNKSRPITRRDWQRYQLRLGDIDPDGMPGKATASAAMVWQRAQGLEPDGRIGPRTQEALEAVAIPWAKIRKVGVWWDLSLRDVDVGELHALGVERVMLMMNKSGERQFISRHSLADVEAVAARLHGAGIDVGLTLWAYCHRDWIQGLGRVIDAYMTAARPEILELDIEGPWSPSKLAGSYQNSSAAADDLGRVLFHAAPDGCERRTTPFADGISSSNTCRRYAVDTLGSSCAIQAYSVASEKGITRPWYDRDGPARMQHRSILAARQRAVSKVSVGLAAWSQTFTGQAPETALMAACEASLLRGCRELDWWSAKWFISSSHRANQYMRAWLVRLRELRGL